MASQEGALFVNVGPLSVVTEIHVFFRYMLKVLEGIAFLKGFGDFWITKVDFNEIWSKKAHKRHPKYPPLGHLGEALGHLRPPLGDLGCPWGLSVLPLVAL